MELSEYAKERDALLEQIRNVLEADARVMAAWLSGSFGRGEEDEWSDLDLHLAIADEHLAEFLEQRAGLYPRVGQRILIQDEMPSDSQARARFQLVYYPGPIEVDWNIGPVTETRVVPSSRSIC